MANYARPITRSKICSHSVAITAAAIHQFEEVQLGSHMYNQSQLEEHEISDKVEYHEVNVIAVEERTILAVNSSSLVTGKDLTLFNSKRL